MTPKTDPMPILSIDGEFLAVGTIVALLEERARDITNSSEFHVLVRKGLAGGVPEVTVTAETELRKEDGEAYIAFVRFGVEYAVKRVLRPVKFPVKERAEVKTYTRGLRTFAVYSETFAMPIHEYAS